MKVKNVLAPLGITAALSAVDAGIQRKNKKKTKKNMAQSLQP